MALSALKQQFEASGRPLLPAWLVKAIIIAIVTVCVGGAGAWIGGVNRIAADAATVNRVQDVQIGMIVEQLKVTNATLSDIRDQLAGSSKVRYVYIPVADAKLKEVPSGQ